MDQSQSIKAVHLSNSWFFCLLSSVVSSSMTQYIYLSLTTLLMYYWEMITHLIIAPDRWISRECAYQHWDKHIPCHKSEIWSGIPSLNGLLEGKRKMLDKSLGTSVLLLGRKDDRKGKKGEKFHFISLFIFQDFWIRRKNIPCISSVLPNWC